MPAGVPHQLWNAGEDDATYLAAAAPPAQGDSAQRPDSLLSLASALGAQERAAVQSG